MSEPTKEWSAGDEIKSDDLNTNFTEALNNYRDFTYGETLAVNDAVYLKAVDGKVYKTDADFSDERIHNFVGFAKEVGDADASKKVQISGKVSGFTGLTTGSRYYLSDTAGSVSTPIGTYEKLVGIAVSATELVIEKNTEGLSTGDWVSGDYCIASTDGLVSCGTSETKIKEIKVNRSGTIKVYFGLKTTSINDPPRARIYVNGVSTGTLREAENPTGWYYFSEDISVNEGDLVQLYSQTGGNTGSAGAFRLLVGNPYPAGFLSGSEPNPDVV